MSDESTSNGDPSLVVGVGASAGGLDACSQLLSHLPRNSGMAFVVVLHLDPTKESHLAEILKARSALAVTQVAEPVPIEPDHVYVIAPNTALKLEDGMLCPVQLEGPRGKQKPIDAMLSSLASSKRETAVAIVLSGIGDDGSAGLQDVHNVGGLCIAQAPETAQHEGMPRSAIGTGAVNAVLRPESIGRFLMEHVAHPDVMPAPPLAPKPLLTTGFEGVLGLLAEEYGLDPSAYKHGTLRRRTERRMSLLSITAWDAYLEHVQTHTEELTALYRDVLIGVTQFFRDPEHWEYFAENVVPNLLDAHRDGMPLRIWSVGCATGEEPYSLAMCFTDELEKHGLPLRLQVFATDVSQDALALARRGTYPLNIADDVGARRLGHFFHDRGEHYQVKRNLRDLVTFAPHDVLSEPPFAQLDLIVCRNLFIYLEHSAQHGCLERFHFALRPRGVLWLGSSENVDQDTDLFSPLSNKFRMFERTALPQRRPVPWTAPFTARLAKTPTTHVETPGGTVLYRRIEQAVLNRFAAPCVIVNDTGRVLSRYGPTERYASPPKGVTRMDLISWVQPGLYAKLRPALSRAIKEQTTVTVSDARIERAGKTVRVGCNVEPLSTIGEGIFCVVFYDEPIPETESTAAPDADADTDERSDVRRLTRMLQETERELRSSIDELENANEEYRASYEELVSLNEELQWSNEELETTKEEAQSINEELMTVNRELEERNAAQSALNADLENLLAITTIPTIFLDRKLRIRRFTPATDRVMWLTPGDVGRSITHIKPRVRDDGLVPDAQKVLATLVPAETEVIAEHGRWYRRQVVPFRSDDRVEGVCVIYYDITGQKLAAEESEEARHFAEAIVRTSRLPFIVLDEKLNVVSANTAFYETFAATKSETEGKPFYRLGNRQWDIPRLREFLHDVVVGTASVQDFEVEHAFEKIGPRQMLINANRMERPERPPLILVSIEDVTELRDAQSAAVKRTRELEIEHRRKDEFLAMLGHELRNPLAALVHGLSVLERDPSQVDKIRKLLTRQTKRMAVMLDQLLDVSRVISGKIQLASEQIDLVEAMKGAVEAVTPMVTQAKQDLVVSLPPEGKFFVRGDVVRLTQVVENLLTNASKYTDPGGKIWLSLTADRNVAEISVKDTGIGIDVELLQHIFDVFTQGPRRLDRAQGGLGLGLPLVRLLVGMHGGDVKAESEGPGKGSQFTVRLPLVTRVAKTTEPSAMPAKRRSRRVVVVDDERDTADTLSEILEAEGHETRAVYCGEAALEAVRTFRPDVVLLDLGLPDIDGYEVASRLRKLGKTAPLLIALTGYQRDDRRLAEAGFDDHLIKPLDLDRLAALLSKD